MVRAPGTVGAGVYGVCVGATHLPHARSAPLLPRGARTGDGYPEGIPHLMANYFAQARSNYFAVRDVDAFRADLERYAIRVDVEAEESGGDQPADGATARVGLFNHEGGIEDPDPNDPDLDPELAARIDAAVDSGEAVDWWPHTLLELIARHLVDGEVAVLMEVGFEKMRYLRGVAEAINSKGETRSVNLDDIYDLATEHLGSNVTYAQW